MDNANIYPYKRIKKKDNIKNALLNKNKFMLFKQLNWMNLLIITSCFFIGRAIVLGELIPFGLAFLTAGIYLMPKLTIPLYMTLIASTISAAGNLGVITTGISGLIIIYLLKMVKQNKYTQLLLAVIPLAAVIVIKTLAVTIYEPSLYNYVAVIIEGILAAVLTLIFSTAFASIKRRKEIGVFTVEELICIVVLLVGILMGMLDIKFGLFSLKGILSRLIILAGAYIGGVGIGAAVGAIIGLIPSISIMASPSAMGVYAFAGLMAGGFKYFGKLGISIGFMLANIILSMFFNNYNSLVSVLGESFIAVLILLLIPNKQLEKIKTIIFTDNVQYQGGLNSDSEKRLRQLTSERIKEFALVFNELSKSFEHLSGDSTAKESDNLQEVFRQLTNKVCTDCSSFKLCWEKEFYKMYKDILDLFTKVEVEGYIDSQQIPTNIRRRCIRTKELAVSINCLYDTYKLENFWRTKMEESREVVSGQLRGVSSIMNNLAQEIKVEAYVKEDIELYLAKELLKVNIIPQSVSVIEDGKGFLEINLMWHSCKSKIECMETIAPAVSQILGRKMVTSNPKCTKQTGSNLCEFSLVPARKFEITYGIAKAAKNNGIISGDNLSTLQMKDGKVALILSDGMGVGPKAAMESRATVGLLEKLMETGFEKDLAVKTVNSVLVLRNPNDTFATVDLLVVDLYTGIGDFIKIGAAPSFIKRKDRVGVIKSSSLPVGILHNIDTDTVTEQLELGDIIIMMTDGILDTMSDVLNKEEWMCGEIQEMITEDPQKIAEIILNKTRAYNHGVPRDDMTVIVAKIIDSL